MEINNQSFKNLTKQRALEILRESTHLSLNVKSNMMGFKEMLIHTDESRTLQDNIIDSSDVTEMHLNSLSNGMAGRFYQKKNSLANNNGRRSTTLQLNQSHCFVTGPGPSLNPKYSWGAAAGTRKKQTLMAANGNSNDICSTGSGSNQKSSIFEKLLTLLKGSNLNEEQLLGIDSTDEVYPNALRTSRSNPDISLHSVNYPSNQRHSSFSTYHQSEQAVKIYKSDQSFRYLTVYPETTAKNIVQLALQVCK